MTKMDRGSKMGINSEKVGNVTVNIIRVDNGWREYENFGG